MKVFITGVSRGLGYTLSKKFSENGYQVIGTTRGKLKNETDNLKIIENFDVTNISHIEKYANEIGDCDILINNAGIAYDGILATQDIENISSLVNTNLIGPITLSKFFIREKLSKGQKGSIINISSIIGIRGYAGLAVYSATKAGLDGMTRALAREMGPKGFRVNSVLPGYFESDLSKDLGENQKNQIIRRTPLGRLAKTEEICEAIIFLASEKASFITGQSLVVDGGITI